jgi:hypothetical protein
MESKRNIKDLRHAQKCVKQLEKLRVTRPLKDNERQELYYWKDRIENEYKKPL